MSSLTPKDGHCLLLMEPQAGQRTFSDYPNVEFCLDGILAIYEGTPDRVLDYTLDTIWKWLDQFESITLYIFDEELARYKKLTHAELEELFIPAIQRASKQENGIKTIANTRTTITNTRTTITTTVNAKRNEEYTTDNHNRSRVFRFDKLNGDDDDEEEEEEWD